MKRVLSNLEIEAVLNILNDKGSFKNNMTIKLPKDFRQALRINLQTLADRYKIYQEGVAEIVKEYVDAEKATVDESGQVQIKKEYMNDITQELNELASVPNELEFVTVPDASVDAVLDVDLSVAEEDVVLLFKER